MHGALHGGGARLLVDVGGLQAKDDVARLGVNLGVELRVGDHLDNPFLRGNLEMMTVVMRRGARGNDDSHDEMMST